MRVGEGGGRGVGGGGMHPIPYINQSMRQDRKHCIHPKYIFLIGDEFLIRRKLFF